MWKKHALMVIVLTVTGALATPPAAHAARPDEAIFGDLDGDGIQDRAFLGIVPPELCSVVVQYGRPGDVFLPPVAYTYLRPGGSGMNIRCPDIGATLQLSVGSAVEELVVAWSGGPPPDLSYNLVVLSNFRPAFTTITRINHPNEMGVIDVNADGRADLYLSSDTPGEGFQAFLSLGDARLTPSPVSFCSGPHDFHLKDLNRDREYGVLIAYTQACADGSNGVVSFRSTGSPQYLERDPAGVETWSTQLVYANEDRYFDIRTVSRLTGQINHFIWDRSELLIRAPRANGDRVTIPDGKKTAIEVLGNDAATRWAEVTITKPPRYGTTQVGNDRRVYYTPEATQGRTDRFEYTITDDGRRSTTSVYLQFAE